MMIRALSVLLVVMSVSAGAAAAGEPALFPDRGPWGVNVHTPYRAQALRDLGVQWVRLDVRWSSVEREARGQYDWSHYDKVLRYYHDEGFAVLAILVNEALPEVYEGDRSNQKLVIDALSRWCATAAGRYKGVVDLWELGNEPQVFPMGGYWDNPVTYTRFARQAAAAIKSADPDVKIGAISSAWMDRTFISRCLRAGLLADGTIDAVTYHGYHRANLLPESGLVEDVTWLRDSIQRHAKGRSVIAVDTERGYKIDPERKPKSWHSWRIITYSESEQAAYLARHYLEQLHLGTQIIVWYKDMHGEDNYSLYYGDETDPRGLRPAGHVYRNLAALLPDNARRLNNDQYDVTLIDLPDTIGAPDSGVPIRTYLRTYVRDGAERRRLVIAVWNPVEAFDGLVLAQRERIGDEYVETWRPRTPGTDDDVIEIPVQMRVAGLSQDKVRAVYQYNLLASHTDAAAHPIEPQWQDDALVSPVLRVGALPTVLVVESEP